MSEPVRMPDLLGLPSSEAARRLGEVEARAGLGLGSAWGRPVAVRCEARPGTVVRQEPAPGTPLERRTVVRVRTAALDLYRFAADPTLGARFAPGEVWIGIEGGPTAVTLAAARLADPARWRVGAAYAERTGPFSALDVLAASGGHYELHPGIVPTCPAGAGQAPPGLAGLRAISLTSPRDSASSCMQWWGVTLFLDGRDRIRGVALRLGSP